MKLGKELCIMRNVLSYFNRRKLLPSELMTKKPKISRTIYYTVSLSKITSEPELYTRTIFGWAFIFIENVRGVSKRTNLRFNSVP